MERCRVQVERVFYTGKVWCVKVSTGAFVARRKGMAFVTGNSGFPKSRNIAMTIDKQAGEMGHRSKAFVVAGRGPRNLADPDLNVAPYTPISDDARAWSGWGTNLKPAWEPFIVGTKPG